MASTCPHGVFLEMMATREEREEAKNCLKKKYKIEIGRKHIQLMWSIYIYIYIHLPCSLLPWRVGIGFLGWEFRDFMTDLLRF